jgi:hypothetical protein
MYNALFYTGFILFVVSVALGAIEAAIITMVLCGLLVLVEHIARSMDK